MASGGGNVDVLALGEAMVEFNQTGAGDGRLYLQGFGGDTSNFAIAAARQGARVGYVSALGADRHGEMLRALWRDEGVDQSGVRTDVDAFTAVYFVSHDAGGHHFDFVRRAGLVEFDHRLAEGEDVHAGHVAYLRSVSRMNSTVA